MKTNNILIWILIAINVCALIYYFTKDRELEKKKEILEIKLLRQEIIKMDSLKQVRLKHFVDSVKVEIGKDKGEIQVIKAINYKLQKLNEKTDRIYSAITVDMPDL